MEEILLHWFYSGMPTLPFFVAFIAGFLSFLSPCVLPLIPAYMSYIAGVSLKELESPNNRRAMRLSVFIRSFGFVFGFGFVFIGFGFVLGGALYLLRSEVLNIIGGLIVIVFGMHFLGIWRIGVLYKTKRFDISTKHKVLQILAPFLLGVSFAFGWSPCTGPIFGAIALMAGSYGMVLLIIYVCGFAVPFLLLGLVLERGFEWLDRFKKHLRVVEICSGMLLIIAGVLLMSGNFSAISTWFVSGLI